jgi:YggT family protein
MVPRALSQRNRSRTAEHAIMDAMSAGSLLLADAISSIQSFISVFSGVYVLLIFAYILTSWVRLPYSPTLNRIQRFLYDVCEPYLRIFRRFLPAFGPLDLSPIVAVFTLILGARILNGILESFR